MTSPRGREPSRGRADGTFPRGPNVSHRGSGPCSGLRPQASHITLGHRGHWSGLMIHSVPQASSRGWSLSPGICPLSAINADAMCGTCVAGKAPHTLQGSGQSHCRSQWISKCSLESTGCSVERRQPQPDLSEPPGMSHAVIPERWGDKQSSPTRSSTLAPHLDKRVHPKGQRLAGCQVSRHTQGSASAVISPPWFSSSKDRNSVIFSQSVSLTPAGSSWPGDAQLLSNLMSSLFTVCFRNQVARGTF